MKSKSAIISVSLALAFVIARVLAQTPITGQLKNFQAPVTEESGRKSIIKGKDASHLGKGIFRIVGPHVDIYKSDGTLDMVIDAIECQFNNDQGKDVWSDREMSVKKSDGQLAIKGVGFRYQPGQSLLNISNKVEAVIRRQVLVDPKVAASTNNSTLTVTSDWMEQHLEAVTFGGHVRVVDPQGEVRCDTLKVRLDEKNQVQQIEAIEDVTLVQGETEARGRRAVFNATSGLLRLSEKTSWRMADQHGSSELLILDRANNTLRAETNVKMMLPSNLLSTNAPSLATAPTNRVTSTNFLTITADTFDYAPSNTVTLGPIAIFNGSVRAVDPQASLDCELLTIFFDRSNHLSQAVADRSVKIERPDGNIQGERARFEHDEITVSGQPKWRLEEKTGTSETVTFNPRTREVRALNVRMDAPTTGATNLLLTVDAANTNQSLATNIMVITANYFTNKNNVATFTGKVRAREARGQIDADQLSVYFNATNRAERVVARGDVILTEDKGQALGQEADYNVATGIIRLTGNPMVMEQERRIIAREFIVDRNTSKSQALPPYRVVMKRKQK